MRSINLTMSNLLTVEETIVYHEHPEDTARLDILLKIFFYSSFLLFFYEFRTQFTQQAAIKAGSLVSGWSNVLEEFSLRRFKQNADVGRAGFNKVLERFVVMAEAQQTTKSTA
jgi:hypothetical protein